MQEDPGRRGEHRQGARRRLPGSGRPTDRAAARERTAFRVHPGRSTTAIGIMRAILRQPRQRWKPREVVGAHDPDEAHAPGSAARDRPGYRPCSAPRCPPRRRSRRWPDGAPPAWPPRSALAVDARSPVSLRGLPGRHDPPDPVEAQAPERHEADVPVPAMGRVERPAVEADPQAGRGAGQAHEPGGLEAKPPTRSAHGRV